MFFSVKSAYLKLDRLMLMEDLWREEEKRVSSRLWKCPAASKVVAFSWKLLLNRVPTRDNLRLRNVLPTEVPNSCVLCDREEESALHLFLHCDIAREVWLAVMRWLGVSGSERNNKIRKVYGLFGIQLSG